jgi:hypothetical protein
LEALNYFCEITTEKLLEGIRTGKLDESGEVKNTVLVLPKIPGYLISIYYQIKSLTKYVHYSKTALVRLGETHTSKCRANRETPCAAGMFFISLFCVCGIIFSIADLKLPPITSRGHQPLPGQLYGFPSAINLPMKQVLMNPFPCSADDFDPFFQEPVLLTLKMTQKYFVPERSVVVQD